ncbi:daunorubicin resistance protein DrrA family ABC transporter ATP-binding protein [Natrinema limicola]|uniref:ATP-binding protein n=1 Tax=Natrinema limicola JCM 13563 TaxID=1230457 RepID=M0C2K0_9EURY|nr:daunorubicin resistance protein DrrA family ABC transporter ATP-binding protein [Natrinema limicola]ELZ17440.1 ATP-binding protein [Natrinema limicola JCM 13563]
MAPPAIRVENLVKRFGDLTAVGGISFQVDEGESFGFLGPNGAGKSTTIRMVTGVLRPDAGAARIAGYDVRTDTDAAKSEIGIVPEQFNAYPDLTAWKNVMLAGELYGIPRQTRKSRGTELLRSFGLFERRHTLATNFSKGMKQRLMLTMALLHDPAVLFLDEPITGLDVESQHLIRERIAELNREGRTVFLTTHNIAEADRLCDRVAIINRGEIAAIDTPDALKQTIERTRAVEVSFNEEVTLDTLAAFSTVDAVEKRGDTIRLMTPDPDTVIKAVVNFAQEENLTLRSLQTLGPSLEDAFTALTEARQ